MDAFVVLDRDAYTALTGIEPDEKKIDKVEGYEPTQSDLNRLKTVENVIDIIYAKY